MPLKKNTARAVPQELGFDQDRLGRLCDSIQPLLTKHASDKELDALLKEAEACVRQPGNWFSRRFGKKQK